MIVNFNKLCVIQDEGGLGDNAAAPLRVSPPPEYPGTPMLANITLNFNAATGSPPHRLQPTDLGQEATCNLQLPNVSRPRVSSPEVIVRPPVT